MGSWGGRQSRRAGVFVRAGDFAFLPHLLFGTPIKSHSFRTFPARSRLSARPGPTMARRSEASPFTRLGTLTIGRVAAQASHRHSPQVTRSRIKPRPPGEKGGRPRGRIRPRRGAAPLGAQEAPAAAAQGASFAAHGRAGGRGFLFPGGLRGGPGSKPWSNAGTSTRPGICVEPVGSTKPGTSQGPQSPTCSPARVKRNQ